MAGQKAPNPPLQQPPLVSQIVSPPIYTPVPPNYDNEAISAYDAAPNKETVEATMDAYFNEGATAPSKEATSAIISSYEQGEADKSAVERYNKEPTKETYLAISDEYFGDSKRKVSQGTYKNITDAYTALEARIQTDQAAIDIYNASPTAETYSLISDKYFAGEKDAVSKEAFSAITTAYNSGLSNAQPDYTSYFGKVALGQDKIRSVNVWGYETTDQGNNPTFVWGYTESGVGHKIGETQLKYDPIISAMSPEQRIQFTKESTISTLGLGADDNITAFNTSKNQFYSLQESNISKEKILTLTKDGKETKISPYDYALQVRGDYERGVESQHWSGAPGTFAAEAKLINQANAADKAYISSKSSVVGIDAFKESEKKYAVLQTNMALSLASTTPGESLAIANMMKSPTARFAPNEIQRGYDIVSVKQPDFNVNDIKAGVSLFTTDKDYTIISDKYFASEKDAVSKETFIAITKAHNSGLTSQVLAEKAILESHGQTLETINLNTLSEAELKNLQSENLVSFTEKNQPKPASTILIPGLNPNQYNESLNPIKAATIQFGIEESKTEEQRASETLSKLDPFTRGVLTMESASANLFSNIVDAFGIKNTVPTGDLQRETGGTKAFTIGDRNAPEVIIPMPSREVQEYRYLKLIKEEGVAEALWQNQFGMAVGTGLAFGGVMGVAAKIAPGVTSTIASSSIGQKVGAIKTGETIFTKASTVGTMASKVSKTTVLGMSIPEAAIAGYFLAPIAVETGKDIAEGQWANVAVTGMSLGVAIPAGIIGQAGAIRGYDVVKSTVKPIISSAKSGLTEFIKSESATINPPRGGVTKEQQARLDAGIPYRQILYEEQGLKASYDKTDIIPDISISTVDQLKNLYNKPPKQQSMVVQDYLAKQEKNRLWNDLNKPIDSPISSPYVKGSISENYYQYGALDPIVVVRAGDIRGQAKLDARSDILGTIKIDTRVTVQKGQRTPTQNQFTEDTRLPVRIDRKNPNADIIDVPFEKDWAAQQNVEYAKKMQTEPMRTRSNEGYSETMEDIWANAGSREYIDPEWLAAHPDNVPSISTKSINVNTLTRPWKPTVPKKQVIERDISGTVLPSLRGLQAAGESPSPSPIYISKPKPKTFLPPRVILEPLEGIGYTKPRSGVVEEYYKQKAGVLVISSNKGSQQDIPAPHQTFGVKEFTVFSLEPILHKQVVTKPTARPTVITIERTKVLPTIANLDIRKPIPSLVTQPVLTTKPVTKTATNILPATKTEPKTKTNPATNIATKLNTAVQTKTSLKTKPQTDILPHPTIIPVPTTITTPKKILLNYPSSLDIEKKERRPRKKKSLLDSTGGKPDPWFPASLESITLEEFQTGKKAIHIKPKKDTQQLFKTLRTTGRAIPTAKQFTSRKLK